MTDHRIDLSAVPAGRSIASLFLLPACGMSCRFCASELGFDAMPFEGARDLLGALRERGFRNVVLGGGEPFLWPHGVVRLAAVAKDLGFLVQASTNGLPLPAGFETTPSIDRYILPLESAEESVHDALRAVRRAGGGHRRLVKSRIDALVRAGREFTISTVVTRANLEGLPALAAELAALALAGARLHAWHIYRFLPVGRGGRPHAPELAVGEAEYRRAVESVRAGPLGFPVYRRDDMLRTRSVEFFWYENGALRIGSEIWTEPRESPDLVRRREVRGEHAADVAAAGDEDPTTIGGRRRDPIAAAQGNRTRPLRERSPPGAKARGGAADPAPERGLRLRPG